MLLVNFATNDRDWFVRVAAVERVTDQAVLAEVAKTDEETSVRRSAIEKLTSQAVLGDIARTDKDEFSRKAAVKNLLDKIVLAEIASTDRDEDVRQAAIAKLTDQSALASVAKTGPSWATRWAATESIEDQLVRTELTNALIAEPLTVYLWSKFYVWPFMETKACEKTAREFYGRFTENIEGFPIRSDVACILCRDRRYGQHSVYIFVNGQRVKDTSVATHSRIEAFLRRCECPRETETTEALEVQPSPQSFTQLLDSYSYDAVLGVIWTAGKITSL